MPSPTRGDSLSGAPESWDDAPCGLVTIDERGVVVSANRRLIDLLADPALVGRAWNDLLSVGSRVFWLTQLAPVLELDGRLDEVMLDLRARDGRRIPALLNAVRIGPAASSGARIAVMGVPDRRAYENELRRARTSAEQAQVVEHSNSVALQQALLTATPRTPGLEIATRYLPATTGNEVGGDWYDAFLQSDGTPVLVIGDVVGHDIEAAAAMGQLRGVLRTLGYPRTSSPADLLTSTDTTARGLGVDVLASAFVARVERHAAGATLRWSNAGHPPPLLMTADGQVRLIEAPSDPILGLAKPRTRREHTDELGTGDIVLLYTDGLVERVDADIDRGIEAVAQRLSGARGRSLDELCDRILAEHQTGRRDDIAVLAVRVL